jgi:hypothetical protein
VIDASCSTWWFGGSNSAGWDVLANGKVAVGGAGTKILIDQGGKGLCGRIHELTHGPVSYWQFLAPHSRE